MLQCASVLLSISPTTNLELDSKSFIREPSYAQREVKTTTSRTSSRLMGYQLAAPMTLQLAESDGAKGQYVGELQERWKFPSDHLPIGATIDGLNYLSWNVLDPAYMAWVTELDSQGIGRSMIADEHVYIEGSDLTVRERHIVAMILDMINNPNAPKDMVSLQECSRPFLEELKARLPENFTVIAHGGNAVVVDLSKFDVVDSKYVSGVFPFQPKRNFQEITLRRKDTGELIRIVNVHLPGDPTKHVPELFAAYLERTRTPGVKTIAMGDMNFTEKDFGSALSEAFSDPSAYGIFSPYCTNIDPYSRYSKAIDHFIVLGEAEVSMHYPEDIHESLPYMVDLLGGSFTEELPLQKQIG